MTAGRGFMALAALIFGRWHPFGALGACLLFGFMDAVAIRLQGVHLAGFGEVPVQLIQTLPYLLTVILLAGFIGRAVAPQALGKPYLKEREPQRQPGHAGAQRRGLGWRAAARARRPSVRPAVRHTAPRTTARARPCRCRPTGRRQAPD